MARYENDWGQLPHVASRGGQASFREFTLRLSRAGQPLPDQGYFQDLIAKAILHRSITAIVRQLGLRGYWANVADYTMAWISHATDSRLDLGLIWKRQALSEAVMGLTREAAPAVHDFIIASASGSNVTQWCKKEECWLRLREELPVTPGDAVMSELMASRSDGEHSHGG